MCGIISNMFKLKKGRMPHSYMISIFGIRIRFRDKLACNNNNIIFVDESGKEHKKTTINGLNIRFIGANSTIKIYAPCPKFENCTFICGDNINITIGGSVHRITNLFAEVTSKNASLNIGKNLALRGAVFSIKERENLTVNIGDDCLIASNVKFWTTDFHSVIDADTKRPLNPPADITLGDHCWVGEDAVIAKGVSLKNDTIVASRAYVTKSFDISNIIIGGVPASIIKENTSWSNFPYDKYLESLA